METMCGMEGRHNDMESLSELKESSPVEVAEYAMAHGLAEEPAFSWWVPPTLKKRDTIVSAVNKRCRKQTHKYGIQVPRSVQEAFKIDRKNEQC
jgi:DNA-directed RNA polymerase subunit L